MPNRLASATSPYLLQHKDNPVDWWEWDDDAFAEARRRDVPVLLSVGYAACHWCHVMAHESFEDPVTAAAMNERYVNIKVDREERPDVDSIYMEAVQAMTGQGGWPMTVWMDHERRPFFAGTYFPSQPRHGMASFEQVMAAISAAWEDRRDDVVEQAEQMVAAISNEMPHGDEPGVDELRAAYVQLTSLFDPVHGGFGGAPKFPQQPLLEFLLRVKDETWAPRAGPMLARSLEAIAAGGIHDHVGGGFARYSVDAHWLVPHFEKMLYDNAQLARLYLWTGIDMHRPDLIEVARTTLDYMARDLRHEDGGFFSSEDADSEGVEGKFYVWTSAELEDLLGDDAQAFSSYFGATPNGNFEGANILHVAGQDPPPHLARSRSVLFEARSARTRPGLDDKVISAWNGLAIRAFAEAGAALEDATYLAHAEEAASFVLERLVVDGALMRSWRDGATSVPGFLDDHAGMAVGLFSLYAATGKERWYHAAVRLVESLRSFANPSGGFYTTAEDAAGLPKRPTDIIDNPSPSGSAMAAEALLIGSSYTGVAGWRDQATRALAAVAVLIDRHPSMVGHHLSIAHTSLDTRELAVVGPSWRDLARVYWSRFRPSVVIAGADEESGEIPLLAGRSALSGALAFVCRGFVCDLPTADPHSLETQLG